MKENIKILYIHGFHIFGENKKKKLIERAVGKKNMMIANINQKRITTVVLSIIIIIIIYFIGSHLILYYIMKKSIKQAEQKIQMYDPDVVVGMYFGAVVAMNLNYKNGKKPLVLVSPSVKTFQKFTHNLGADLSTFPYVIIVNGSKDTTTTMSTCDELVSTIPIGKGRLEIVDDDHSYSKLKESDFKSWIKEAKYKPSTCLVNVTKKLKDEQLGQRIKIKTNSFTEIAPFENENENANEDDQLV
ncbi:hypothetical protein YYG_03668 [Plasmodium vinckei petteri]|uniref:Uncharacterized protein n=1 Tax=Plasmodium vinckei petteri TaxID=138298 RepID=W7ACT0_PLAVN|nr:hypothetical protein YYG_03668 [Plasmodium vinckei petteri]